MSLFDGILDQYDTPAEPVPVSVPDVDIPFTVTIKMASNGQRIMICSTDPAPRTAINEARKEGVALFTLAEIPLMKSAVAADPRFLDHIIAAKRTFPGAHISQFTTEVSCPGQ